jgi:hypothetical protein
MKQAGREALVSGAGPLLGLDYGSSWNQDGALLSLAQEHRALLIGVNNLTIKKWRG